MYHTITFGKLSAMALDFVDSNDGFLYLRLVGDEPTANAIWAKLSAREGRSQKWASPVTIPLPGRAYPERVAMQKGVTYRTLRARLPSGLVDMAMIHPRLTVAEDTGQGFYLLTYQQTGVPPGFFERLNANLSIPIKAEWSPWLWEQGQQGHRRLTLQSKTEIQDGQRVERQHLVQTTDMPIQRLSGLGPIACYSVRCGNAYRETWWQIIRDQAGLGLRLHRHTDPGTDRISYTHPDWTLLQERGETGQWRLDHLGQPLLAAPSLEHLLTEAREALGLPFVIGEQDAG